MRHRPDEFRAFVRRAAIMITLHIVVAVAAGQWGGSLRLLIGSVLAWLLMLFHCGGYSR